jgi:hypothetical protein
MREAAGEGMGCLKSSAVAAPRQFIFPPSGGGDGVGSIIIPTEAFRRETIRSNTMKSLLRVLGFLFVTGTLCPAAPADAFNILQFGAVSDGKTLNTSAIQQAIDRCHENGGGSVVVPAGQFLTGGLRLRGNVQLYLEKGAVLLGSTQPGDYPDNSNAATPSTSDVAGRPSDLALIFAGGESNISIAGPGTIDGQGKELAHHVAEILKKSRPPEKTRPQLLYFSGCQKIVIQDVTLKNSSCWVETYEKCDGVTLQNIQVDSTAYWNNDGIDLVDSKNVVIKDCSINSADDGICLKSHDPHDRCENVTITNCKVRSSASALKLGTASLGGFRKIEVKDLYVYDTFRSAIALECVDGGVLEDIDIDGVTADNTGNALFICLHQRHGTTNAVRNISIRNVRASIPEGKPDVGYDTEGPALRGPQNLMPSSIIGLPGKNVENVTLENIEITSGGNGKPLAPVAGGAVPERETDYPEFSMLGELPAWGLYLRHVQGIKLKNVQLRALKDDYRPAFAIDDVRGLQLDGVNAEPKDLSAAPSEKP